MIEGFARFDAFPHWKLEEWRPAFPTGRLDRIYLHWSGGDYATVYPAYHYCVASDGSSIYVAQTHDLRDNMRDVYADDAPYATHTARRNSFAAGLSVMGMQNARSSDFGAYPLRDDMIDVLCAVAARIATAYAIPLAKILTHAEAAVEDGYFGEGDDQRWDIARFAPSLEPLLAADATAAGIVLRARIAEKL
jgi:N-acetylmuramoyl-L-alanine amidase